MWEGGICPPPHPIFLKIFILMPGRKKKGAVLIFFKLCVGERFCQNLAPNIFLEISPLKIFVLEFCVLKITFFPSFLFVYSVNILLLLKK